MPKIRLNLLMGVLMMAIVATTTGPASAASEEQTRLLVIVTSENAEVQGMALVLSRQSLMKGAGVQILLCGPAGDCPVRRHG